MKRDLKNVGSFNDRVGRAVYPGDEIVYAVRWGSSIKLKVGKVLAVFKDESCTVRPWNILVKGQGQTNISHLEKPDCIVKVRTAKEIKLAELEAEARALPHYISFGDKAYDD